MKTIKLVIETNKGLIEYEMNSDGNQFWNNFDPDLKVYSISVLGSHNVDVYYGPDGIMVHRSAS